MGLVRPIVEVAVDGSVAAAVVGVAKLPLGVVRVFCLRADFFTLGV